ncbi:hypothetical protein EBR25_11500 [bacterium]|nr:hypothetical protein [bacterium]
MHIGLRRGHNLLVISFFGRVIMGYQKSFLIGSTLFFSLLTAPKLQAQSLPHPSTGCGMPFSTPIEITIQKKNNTGDWEPKPAEVNYINNNPNFILKNLWDVNKSLIAEEMNNIEGLLCPFWHCPIVKWDPFGFGPITKDTLKDRAYQGYPVTYTVEKTKPVTVSAFMEAQYTCVGLEEFITTPPADVTPADVRGRRRVRSQASNTNSRSGENGDLLSFLVQEYGEDLSKSGALLCDLTSHRSEFSESEKELLIGSLFTEEDVVTVSDEKNRYVCGPEGEEGA